MWPVMNEASSDARKTIASATSSGRPRRSIGTVAARAALFSGVLAKRVNKPVSVGPGATAFTRIPDLAVSHAIEGITKSVALETAKSGIRVNAVAPGPTDTGLLTRFASTPENKAALAATVPMDRLGLPEEVADAIVFLASDEASFITGHILAVDGGKTAN